MILDKIIKKYESDKKNKTKTNSWSKKVINS